MMNHTIPGSSDSRARALAMLSLAVGAYGLWRLAGQFRIGMALGDLDDWLSILVTAAQIGLAWLGGIWLWLGRQRDGARLLVVLACSSLPALASFVSYISVLGLGLYVQWIITDQGSGLQAGFLYGFATQVAISPDSVEHVIGINLVAPALMVAIRRFMD